MTILTDLNERRRLARARLQPHLWFTPFSVPEILARVRAEHFPEAPPDVGLFSVNRGPLACIEVGEASPTIYFHQVLNHAETPEEVFTLICQHELLHLRIEPALEGKRLNQHPPAFWDAEKTIAPERRLAWCWIFETLVPSCLPNPASARPENPFLRHHRNRGHARNWRLQRRHSAKKMQPRQRDAAHGSPPCCGVV